MFSYYFFHQNTVLFSFSPLHVCSAHTKHTTSSGERETRKKKREIFLFRHLSFYVRMHTYKFGGKLPTREKMMMMGNLSFMCPYQWMQRKFLRSKKKKSWKILSHIIRWRWKFLQKLLFVSIEHVLFAVGNGNVSLAMWRGEPKSLPVTLEFFFFRQSIYVWDIDTQK